MSEPRDRWSKAQVIFAAIGTLVVPLVVLIVGNWLRTQQEGAAEATRQSERLTSLLHPLASDNPRERRLAIEIAGYLAQKGQLPLELVPVLADIVRNDTTSATAQAASGALAQVEKANPQLSDQIQSNLARLPARVYFHISSEAQRPAAARLASELQGRFAERDVVVPGIDLVNGPSQSQLRYFKKAEKAEAERILATLQSLGVDVRLEDLSAKYETSTDLRARHFELWLSSAFKGKDG